MRLAELSVSFNTVNGKYCCNLTKYEAEYEGLGFNTVNGKYCCNGSVEEIDGGFKVEMFQYRKR